MSHLENDRDWRGSTHPHTHPHDSKIKSEVHGRIILELGKVWARLARLDEGWVGYRVRCRYG